MTKWHVHSPTLDESDKDFTAGFTCTNGETGKVVLVKITQQRGTVVSDMVGALRASAELLRQAANDTLEPTKFN